MQSVYEGNVRFEHCYRLDLERDAAPTHRLACWEEWVTTYSYGQPGDKIEYAKRRLRYLNAGETSPPGLNLATSQLAAEAPTEAQPNVHAPPPSTAPAPPAPGPATTAALAPTGTPGAPALPGVACAGECARVFGDCVAPCVGASAEPPARCISCEPDYGRCMQRCYQQ